jgi:hypothetical protein
LKWPLAFLVAIYALAVVGLAVFQRRLLYFPGRRLTHPAEAGMSGVEELRLSWAKEPIEAVVSGRRCRKTLREPFSVNSRTSLRSAEMEIGKWRAETGARNPRPKDENARNCRPETGARQPNPPEYQR